MNNNSVNTQTVGALESRWDELQRNPLTLDLTRGKPAPEQLALSDALDGILSGNYRHQEGTDARN